MREVAGTGNLQSLLRVSQDIKGLVDLTRLRKLFHLQSLKELTLKWHGQSCIL